MNFIEQDFPWSRFLDLAFIVESSSHRKGIPVKAMHQLLESRMIKITHEDGAMLCYGVQIRTQCFCFLPPKARCIETLCSVHVGRIKVMQGLRALDIQFPIVGIEEC